MIFKRLSLILALGLHLATLQTAFGDQAYYDDAYQAEGDDQAQGDDGNQGDDGGNGGNDDAMSQYLNGNDQYSSYGFGAGDDYIKYWTEYALLPKRCIV